MVAQKKLGKKKASSKRVQKEKKKKTKKGKEGRKGVGSVLIQLQGKANAIKKIISKMFEEDLDAVIYNERLKRLNGVMRQIELLASEKSSDDLRKEGMFHLELLESELKKRAHAEVIIPFEYLDENKHYVRGDIRIDREDFIQSLPRSLTVMVDDEKHTIKIDQKEVVKAWLSNQQYCQLNVDGKRHQVLVTTALDYLRLGKAVNCLASEISLLQRAKAQKQEIEELERIKTAYLESLSQIAKSIASRVHERKKTSYLDSYLYKVTKATMLREAVNMCMGSTVHFVHEGKNYFGKLRGMVDERLIVEVEDEQGFWLFRPRKVFHVSIDNIVYVRPEDLVHQLRLKEKIDDLSREILDVSSDPNRVLRDAISVIAYVESNPRLLERIISLARDYREKQGYGEEERDLLKKLDVNGFKQLKPEEKIIILRDGIANM